MKRSVIVLSACIGIAGTGLAVRKNIDMHIFPDSCSSNYISTSDELKEKAKAITVKVMSANGGGSGTIIAREKNIYTVLTNQHVLTPGEPYRIQTADGLIYPAKLVKKVNFASNDLALLEFTGADNIVFGIVASNSSSYTSISTPSKDEEVLASGFSAEGNVLTFNTGRISMLPDKAFQGGYRIGYTNDIQKGMSGEPILNRWGKLVGINGVHAYPLFGNPYIFEDGSKADETQKQQMTRLSWGIPIQTLSKFTPEFIEPNATTNKIEEIAQKITVLITSSNGNGSGVIIAHQDENYYVLTANYVVRDKAKYKITTADGRCHQVDYKTVKRFKGADLAVLQFTSKQLYQVATLSKYELDKEDNNTVSFISGWAASKQEKPEWAFSPGSLLNKESALSVTYDSLSLTEGYDLVYTNLTADGMSGGPVLDTSGRVIGIHGKAEGEVIVDEAGKSQRVQLGYSLGIPISSFLTVTNIGEIKPEWLKIEITAPPSLMNLGIYLGDLMITRPFSVYQQVNLCNTLWRQLSVRHLSIKCLDTVTEIKPDFYQAHYLKSLALLSRGQEQEAFYSVEKAIQVNSKFYQAWRLRGMILGHLNQDIESLESINKAIKLNPQDFLLYSLRGDALYKLKRYSEAIDSINKAIQIEPDFAGNYGLRGNIREEVGDIKGAISDYDKVIRLKPKSIQGYANRGRIYIELKNYKKAIDDYNEAISLKPEFIDAYINRGSIYAALKNYKQAIDDYSKAISLEPEFIEVYINRGEIYATLKNYKQAIDDYSKAIHLNPNDAKTYYNRGTYYVELKDYKQAINDYNKAIQLKPDFANSYINRSLTNFKLKNYKQVLPDLNEAIRLQPDYADAYFRRGVFRFALANKQQGITDLQKAAQIYQNQGNIAGYQQVQDVLKKLK